MPRALLYIRSATVTGPTDAGHHNGSDQPQLQASFPPRSPTENNSCHLGSDFYWFGVPEAQQFVNDRCANCHTGFHPASLCPVPCLCDRCGEFGHVEFYADGSVMCPLGGGGGAILGFYPDRSLAHGDSEIPRILRTTVSGRCFARLPMWTTSRFAQCVTGIIRASCACRSRTCRRWPRHR